jgi:hypothetical protein
MAKKTNQLSPLENKIGALKVPEPIENIESRMLNHLNSIGSIKQEMYKELITIYRFRDAYFPNDPDIREDFRLYLADFFNQSVSACYSDFKVIKMLVDYDERDKILNMEKSGMVFILKRIATDKKPDELLKHIDEYDRESIDAEVKSRKKTVTRLFSSEKRLEGLQIDLNEESPQLITRFDYIDGNEESKEETLKKLNYIKDIIENFTDTSIESTYKRVVKI